MFVSHGKVCNVPVNGGRWDSYHCLMDVMRGRDGTPACLRWRCLSVSRGLRVYHTGCIKGHTGHFSCTNVKLYDGRGRKVKWDKEKKGFFTSMFPRGTPSKNYEVGFYLYIFTFHLHFSCTFMQMYIYFSFVIFVLQLKLILVIAKVTRFRNLFKVKFNYLYLI